MSLADRFWLKVDRRGDDECWPWTASRHGCGYGQIWEGGDLRRMLGAHRVSWEMHFGPVPADRHVLHHCDNPPCVNPWHLFLGTATDNMRDMWAKERGRPLRGEMNGRSKLSVEDVVTIRKEHASGRTVAAIARERRMANNSIRDIVTGRHWRHVPEPQDVAS